MAWSKVFGLLLVVSLGNTQESCVSHPLPEEVVNKIMTAANFTIAQNDPLKRTNGEVCIGDVETQVLATLVSIQSSLTATKDELSTCKRDWRNALLQISAIQSSLSTMKMELDGLRGKYDNVSRCKDGWILFGNSCYYFGKDEGDWFHGRKQCLSLGADYVKITDNPEWNFLYAQSGNFWIGLNDLHEEGVYKWISDNSTMTDLNWYWWHEGNPDNEGEGEQCVSYLFFRGKKLWNDTYCHYHFPYICEMAATAV